jgi:hypothetical protein
MTAAETLVAIAKLATLFRTADGDTAYATFDVTSRGETHRETWSVRSKVFRRWLVGQFYKVESKPPGGQAVADALGVIEAQAQFDGAMHPVHVRVAGDDEAIYLDLVNDAWQTVRVTAAGWSVLVTEPPVKFRRARGMLPLPRPTAGASIDLLRHFLNVENDEQWTLLLGWLAATLRPSGPYPVLALLGEQGTAKSTTQEVFRALIDPNIAQLRAEPMDVRDVMIAASNGWCVAFDNLSDIEPWLSDCLCRLATGGGFSTRELYSDGDEVIFVAQRPVMLNGIEAVISRADLLDRALIVDLPRIPDRKRRQRANFWAAFDAARPMLLGALLDAIVIALKRHPDINLVALPRMADFASWAVAAEPGLGLTDGAFLRAYSGNRRAAHDLALEASAIAPAVQALADREEWIGTAAKLLDALNQIADDAAKRLKGWPETARAVGGALRRIVTNLRAVGVEVTFEREAGTGQRKITIRKRGNSTVTTVTADGRRDDGDGSDDENTDRSGRPGPIQEPLFGDSAAQ